MSFIKNYQEADGPNKQTIHHPRQINATKYLHMKSQMTRKLIFISQVLLSVGVENQKKDFFCQESY